uniref:Uncharacterized protein n=1 Tax=Anguilla anguilla TaxID=7936 RepID=A0A0E9XLQ2_ANGAN
MFRECYCSHNILMNWEKLS